MSYTDNVANFLLAPTNDYEVNLADLELVAGDVIEKVRSRPNSPLGNNRIEYRLSRFVKFFNTSSFQFGGIMTNLWMNSSLRRVKFEIAPHLYIRLGLIYRYIQI